MLSGELFQVNKGQSPCNSIFSMFLNSEWQLCKKPHSGGRTSLRMWTYDLGMSLYLYLANLNFWTLDNNFILIAWPLGFSMGISLLDAG